MSRTMVKYEAECLLGVYARTTQEEAEDCSRSSSRLRVGVCRSFADRRLYFHAVRTGSLRFRAISSDLQQWQPRFAFCQRFRQVDGSWTLRANFFGYVLHR